MKVEVAEVVVIEDARLRMSLLWRTRPASCNCFGERQVLCERE